MNEILMFFCLFFSLFGVCFLISKDIKSRYVSTQKEVNSFIKANKLTTPEKCAVFLNRKQPFLYGHAYEYSGVNWLSVNSCTMREIKKLLRRVDVSKL